MLLGAEVKKLENTLKSSNPRIYNYSISRLIHQNLILKNRFGKGLAKKSVITILMRIFRFLSITLKPF